jgi:hypothetical protein
LFNELVEHERGSQLLDFGDVVQQAEDLRLHGQVFGKRLQHLPKEGLEKSGKQERAFVPGFKKNVVEFRRMQFSMYA